MWRLFAVLLIGTTAGTALFADEHKTSGLTPVIPPAKGEQCVEPTEIMRREHMTFLLHQRDDTVIDGIRTQKYQLTRCLGCHVQPDETGAYPRHTSNEHFCTSCHSFTSVKIDCFECHADRPNEYYTQRAQMQSGRVPKDRLLNALAGMAKP